MVGAGDVLDQEHFWLWCKTVFGHLENAEFAAQMQQLIVEGDASVEVGQEAADERGSGWRNRSAYTPHHSQGTLSLLTPHTSSHITT